MRGAMSPSQEQPLPIRDDYGRGTYRRRIRLVASGDEIQGELADDFHHFAVRLRHDGERVVDIEGEDIRVPWTTCPGAMAAGKQIVGAKLTLSLLEVARQANLRAQCTHLFDLASLAVSHAARVVSGGARSRQYDASLADFSRDRPEGTPSSLTRDGGHLFAWRIDRMTILAADDPLFAGRKLSSQSFYRFVEGELDAEAAEAALVLRRAVFIGLGRRYDFDRISHAAEFAKVVGSACHTFDPARVDGARRVIGTVRDFSKDADGILDRQ
jgi:hypothetical protein